MATAGVVGAEASERPRVSAFTKYTDDLEADEDNDILAAAAAQLGNDPTISGSMSKTILQPHKPDTTGHTFGDAHQYLASNRQFEKAAGNPPGESVAYKTIPNYGHRSVVIGSQ